MAFDRGMQRMNRETLLENELKAFVDCAKKNYQPEKIILFGSLASGKVTNISDLDLIVVAKTKEDFWTRLLNISKYCSHKVGMDVLVYTPEEFTDLINSRSFFRREIQQKGKVIYDKTQSA